MRGCFVLLGDDLKFEIGYKEMGTASRNTILGGHNSRLEGRRIMSKQPMHKPSKLERERAMPNTAAPLPLISQKRATGVTKNRRLGRSQSRAGSLPSVQPPICSVSARGVGNWYLK
jgi:hypothetical protein